MEKKMGQQRGVKKERVESKGKVQKQILRREQRLVVLVLLLSCIIVYPFSALISLSAFGCSIPFT